MWRCARECRSFGQVVRAGAVLSWLSIWIVINRLAVLHVLLKRSVQEHPIGATDRHNLSMIRAMRSIVMHS